MATPKTDVKVDEKVNGQDRYYKNLTWLWDADRKFRPEGHCLASRGCAEWR